MCGLRLNPPYHMTYTVCAELLCTFVSVLSFLFLPIFLIYIVMSAGAYPSYLLAKAEYITGPLVGPM